MNRYGQTLTYGPLSAPSFFTCEPLSYSLRDAVTKQNIDGAAGDWLAMALHSRKAEINFEGKVTVGSKDFLDLSAGGTVVRRCRVGARHLEYLLRRATAVLGG